jgi:hypothetical protein
MLFKPNVRRTYELADLVIRYLHCRNIKEWSLLVTEKGSEEGQTNENALDSDVIDEGMPELKGLKPNARATR